jgi:outer membrane protein
MNDLSTPYRSFLLLLLALSNLLQAQDRQPLPLEAAVQLSLKNSKKLQFHKAIIDEANAVLKQSQDNMLPSAAVSGSALWLHQPNISLNESLKNTNNGGTAKAPPKVNSAFYGMLNLSQPVFAGFKLKSGIESARYLVAAARLDAEFDRDAIIENTVMAYTNLYKADALIYLIKENLTESNQRVKDYTNLEKNGILARNDLLKAALEVSNLELGLLEAEKDRKLANVNMNILLGLPSDTSFGTSLPNAEDAANTPLADWLQTAARQRKDMGAIKAREKAAGSGITAARGDLYPGIAVTAGYIAADVPGLLRITNAVNAGLGIKYNLSSLWKTKAAVQAATARQQQLKITAGILEDNITLQLNKDYEEALVAGKKIAVLQKAIEQANENYRIVSNKFNNSIATTQEVLDANVAKLRAQLNYEFAKADAQVSYFKLAATAGVIQEQFKTTLK